MENDDRKKRLTILVVLSSLFLLNDFLFIAAKGYPAWLAIDYGTRLLAIGIVVYLVRKKISRPAEFGLTTVLFRTGLYWTLLLTITGILIDQVGWRFFEKILPDTRLAAMPKIGNSLVDLVDLTVGIALVAFSEEIIFRGYCHAALRDRMGPRALVFVSVVLFGFIHWSTGLHAVVSAALWGVLPMMLVIRTGSVYPALIAHYLTDLVSQGGFVPERWFDFMQ